MTDQPFHFHRAPEAIGKARLGFQMHGNDHRIVLRTRHVHLYHRVQAAEFHRPRRRLDISLRHKRITRQNHPAERVIKGSRRRRHMQIRIPEKPRELLQIIRTTRQIRRVDFLQRHHIRTDPCQHRPHRQMIVRTDIADSIIKICLAEMRTDVERRHSDLHSGKR